MPASSAGGRGDAPEVTNGGRDDDVLRFETLPLERFRFPFGLEITRGDPVDLVRAAVDCFPPSRPCVLVAAHVTTLNAWQDRTVLRAFEAASGAYVDGVSVIAAAAMYGVRLHKLATTDFAPELIAQLGRELGRPVTVVIVGGEPGVADVAAQTLTEMVDIEVLLTEHGYHEDWTSPLARVRDVAPDVLILGMGMPLEARWIVQHHQDLPQHSIVITSGGWLRLLAHSERRSPKLMQKLQLEWLYRLLTNPTRTTQRYARGVRSLLHIAVARLRRGSSSV